MQAVPYGSPNQSIGTQGLSSRNPPGKKRNQFFRSLKNTVKAWSHTQTFQIEVISISCKRVEWFCALDNPRWSVFHMDQACPRIETPWEPETSLIVITLWWLYQKSTPFWNYGKFISYFKISLAFQLCFYKICLPHLVSNLLEDSLRVDAGSQQVRVFTTGKITKYFFKDLQLKIYKRVPKLYCNSEELLKISCSANHKVGSNINLEPKLFRFNEKKFCFLYSHLCNYYSHISSITKKKLYFLHSQSLLKSLKTSRKKITKPNC